jgi:uncharacterized protein
MQFTRRRFLQSSGMLSSAGLLAPSLAALIAAPAAAKKLAMPKNAAKDYGPLQPTPDQHGRNVLALPKGFSYVTLSAIGETMTDGNLAPASPDGMTCIGVAKDRVRLIRNHELLVGPGAITQQQPFSVGGPAETRYDPLGAGGTVTLEFDIKRKTLLSHFVSLNGTILNCAGGLSYKQAGWLSCEESVVGPRQGLGKKHGYVFHVPVTANKTVQATPIIWMGRFLHEAVATNSKGVMYLTEDHHVDAGFFRATPNDPVNPERGGKLEMLAIKNQPRAKLHTQQTIGDKLPIEWVAIDVPDPDLEAGQPRCFDQGQQRGGASFSRLEGAFCDVGDVIYFVSTTGGNKRLGQIWRYLPISNTQPFEAIELVAESQGTNLLESPDNVCISPRGGILVCEDDALSNRDTHALAPQQRDVNRLIGIGRYHPEPFEFALNLLNNTEFAGTCYSPDGSTLFANVFGDGTANSGMTCAIWGPWQDGLV